MIYILFYKNSSPNFKDTKLIVIYIKDKHLIPTWKPRKNKVVHNLILQSNLYHFLPVGGTLFPHNSWPASQPPPWTMCCCSEYNLAFFFKSIKHWWMKTKRKLLCKFLRHLLSYTVNIDVCWYVNLLHLYIILWTICLFQWHTIFYNSSENVWHSKIRYK